MIKLFPLTVIFRAFFVINAFILIVSCNNSKSDTENVKGGALEGGYQEANNDEDSNIDFNNPRFKNRAEEIAYIREYANLKFPDIIIEKFPERVEGVQFNLIKSGEDVSLREAAKRSLHYRNEYGSYMDRVVEENISFEKAKWELDNYKEYRSLSADNYRKELIKEMIDKLKEKPIGYINDSKNNLFTDSSENYLTVEDYIKEKYHNSRTEYYYRPTENPDEFVIFVDVYEENEKYVPVVVYKFEYSLKSYNFRYLGIMSDEEMSNGD